MNNGRNKICAKIADDVDVIDMSTVCYAADPSQNLKEQNWEPIGNSDKNMYQGTFDGNGKTISNLYINATSQFAGFFGFVNNSSIKDITFDNAKVKNTDYDYIGILAGGGVAYIIENIKTLANCSVEGNLLKFPTPIKQDF